MLPYRNTRIASIGAVIFFVALGLYAMFAGRNILWGPVIHISGGSTSIYSTEPTLAVSGTADRIAELRINGRPAPVTEDGSFDEVVPLSPGLNRIQLSAFDKAGRSTERIIEVVYQAPEKPSAPPVDEE